MYLLHILILPRISWRISISISIYTSSGDVLWWRYLWIVPNKEILATGPNLRRTDHWPSDKMFPDPDISVITNWQNDKQTPASSVWIQYVWCSDTLISKTINRMTILHLRLLGAGPGHSSGWRDPNWDQWWSYNEAMTSSVLGNFDNDNNFHIKFENNTRHSRARMSTEIFSQSWNILQIEWLMLYHFQN